MAEVLVVSQSLTVIGLILATKMSTTAFFSIKRIATHQHAQLKEIVDSPGFFKCLIYAFTGASHTQIFFKFALQRRQLRECFFKTLLSALHTAVVPNNFAQFAMKPIW